MTTTETRAETERVEVAGGQVQIRCTDCHGWILAANGGTIPHGRRCSNRGDRTYYRPETEESTTAAQPAPAAKHEPDWRAAHFAAKRGEVASVLSDDEIVDAVRMGRLSVSDAMNRDF